MMKGIFLVVGLVVATGSVASAAPIAITEWMYSAGTGTNPGPGEYFEITNISGSPVNMTGWTEDDSTSDPPAGGPGLHSLSAFGTLQPGESAVGTEGADATAFRTYWNLPASVKVIAYGSSNNLGRADSINIYDNTNARVDRLQYDDQTIGGPRTNGTSANIPFSQLGMNHANLAASSSVGDIYGSYRGGVGGAGSDLGNPGSYLVPEPASIVLGVVGVIAAFGVPARRRS
jgi:predicted extracellular nuclease